MAETFPFTVTGEKPGQACRRETGPSLHNCILEVTVPLDLIKDLKPIWLHAP